MMSLSDVIYGKQLSTSSIRDLWLLWLCLFVSLISPSLSVNVSCCPEGTMWQRTFNCSNGTRIRLNCSDIFSMDPQQKHDNFTVIYEEGTAWLLSEYENVPLDRFCIAKSMQNGGEIALVCFDGELIDDGVPMWKNMLICTISIISAIFLITTLAIYIILPELRELQDKAMMTAVTTLAVSYIVLSILHLRPNMDDDYIICVSLGFILYFAFISAFFWMNIVAFNVWRCVWFKSKIKEQSLFYAYCVWGWGGPTCFLIAALTTHHIPGNHLRPGFNEYSCWFTGITETWAYFYGPVAVLLTLNMLYLGMTSWRLWHQYREYTGSKLRIMRLKCLLYIKLVLVMGITWIFELLSFVFGPRMNEFWILTDLLNGLQGFIIFLLLVVMRKRVRKLLAKKRLCGIAFPKSWAAYEDEECEAVLHEELELSQQG